MDKKFVDGLKHGSGFLLVLLVAFSAYAVGFHQTSEILPGTFQGDYSFNGSINVSTQSNSTVPLNIEGNFKANNLSSQWNYKKTITIDNSVSSQSLTNYQIPINIDTSTPISSSKMQSNCQDIRFFDPSTNKELDYWIESGCNTTSTKIWVKVPSIPTSSSKNISLYYGK